MEPPHVAGLKWIIRQCGELSEAVGLRHMAMMTTGRGWRVSWVKQVARERGVHSVGFLCVGLLSGDLQKLK